MSGLQSTEFLVLMVCLALMLFFVPPLKNVKLTPQWEVPIDASVYRDGHTPEDSEKLPPPLVTDIDGDGLADLVYVTTDAKLRVVDGSMLSSLEYEVYTQSEYKEHGRQHSHVGRNGLHLPEPRATYEASLVPPFAVSHGRKPVALNAGYLDPADDEDIVRRQIVCVLTEGWIVMCFNHRLQLMWEAVAVEETDPMEYHMEAAILINPTPVRNMDRGLVVVAGRMVASDLDNEQAGHEHFDKMEFEADVGDLTRSKIDLEGEEDSEAREKQLREAMQKQMEMMQKQRKMRFPHFTYFAFEGHTGEQIWSHGEEDFLSDPLFRRSRMGSPEERMAFDLEDDDLIGADEPLKMHMIQNAMHMGEVEWIVFYDDMIRQTPHFWFSRENTHLKADSFSRTRRRGGGNVHPSESLSQGYKRPESKDPGSLYYSGLASQSSLMEDSVSALNNQLPNVVVGSTSHGIEVLHYYTGRPLTKLMHPNPNSVLQDINGDGLLERIETFTEFERPTAEGEENKKFCYVRVTVGMVNLLFEAELCGPNSIVSGLRLGTTTKGLPAIAPAAVVQRDFDEWDILLYLSDGTLVSLNPDGDIMWKTASGCSWNSRVSNTGGYGRKGAFLEMGSADSLLHPFRNSVFDSSNTHVLLTGSNMMCMVDLVDGSVLMRVANAGSPIAPVLFTDFNNDGFTDFIVTTANGYIAYSVSTMTSQSIFSILLALLVVIVGLVGCVQSRGSKKSRVSKGSHGL